MTAAGRPPTANELPVGWVWATLGEVCEPIVQVNPRKTMPDELIKYVDISSVDNERNEIVGHKEVLGSEAPSRARKPIRADDILFATVRTYLRNVAMVPSDYDGEIASTGFCVLRSCNGIQPHFVFRYLLTNEFIQRISEKQRGISYPAVTDRDVYAEPIPLPPEAEQQRIVVKIETLFQQSRRGQEALDAVPELLTQFRQAVLAAAFRGDLTERDPADEPASVLLERIRAERHRKWEEDLRAKGKDPSRRKYKEPALPDTSELPELPEGWMWVTTEMLAADEPYSFTDGPFGSNLKTADYVPAGVRVIRLQNLGVAEFKDQDKAFVSEEKFDALRKHEAKAGDVVIGALADPVGRACLVPEGLGPAMVKADCIRLRVHPHLAISKYVMLALNTPDHFERAEELAHGVGRLRVNLSNIKSFVVPLAPLPEQRRLVARIEALFAQADALEAAATAAHRRLEQVDQAILSRAFRGELVEQDPDDEPASMLLTRIKQETAQGTKVRKAERASEVPESAEPLQKEVECVKSPSELTELLNRLQRLSDKPVSPETLWLESKLEIDEFYAFLKQEVIAGRIVEQRKGRKVHLEVTV